VDLEIPEIMAEAGPLMWDMRALIIPAFGFAIFAAVVRILKSLSKSKLPGVGVGAASAKPPGKGERG